MSEREAQCFRNGAFVGKILEDLATKREAGEAYISRKELVMGIFDTLLVLTRECGADSELSNEIRKVKAAVEQGDLDAIMSAARNASAAVSASS